MKRLMATLVVVVAALTVLPAAGFANSWDHDGRFNPAFAHPAPQPFHPQVHPGWHRFHPGFRPHVAYPAPAQWVWTPGTWYWNGVGWAWMPGRWVLVGRPGF